MSTKHLIEAIANGDAVETSKAFDKEMLGKISKRLSDMQKEVVKNLFKNSVNEVLSKDASVGDWIHDFVNSDNPKFDGKSKDQRKKMALAAYYAKQQEDKSK